MFKDQLNVLYANNTILFCYVYILIDCDRLWLQLTRRHDWDMSKVVVDTIQEGLHYYHLQ